MRRLVPWIALGIPIAYVGIILAVVIHEVVGHGLTAIVCGGEFQRFEIYPDGGGAAWTEETGRLGRAAVLAGGIASDVVFGALCLLAAGWKRFGPRARLVLLIFATTLFHDGLPYGFWGALLEGDHGDISNLLLYMEPAQTLRLTLIVLFGLLYPLSMFVTSRAIFRTLEDGMGALGAGLASLIAGAMTVFIGVGYATFEWDTLISGAGLYPTVSATLLQGGIGVWLVKNRRATVELVEPGRRSWAASLLIAWALMGATLAITLTWLRHGVELS